MSGLQVIAALIITEGAAALGDRLLPPRARLWLNTKMKQLEKMRPFNDR